MNNIPTASVLSRPDNYQVDPRFQHRTKRVGRMEFEGKVYMGRPVQGLEGDRCIQCFPFCRSPVPLSSRPFIPTHCPPPFAPPLFTWKRFEYMLRNLFSFLLFLSRYVLLVLVIRMVIIVVANRAEGGDGARPPGQIVWIFDVTNWFRNGDGVRSLVLSVF